MKRRNKGYFVNLIFPAFVFGSITGTLTGAAVTLYKACAARVIALSEAGYHLLRESSLWLLAVVPALLGISFLYAYVYRRIPNLRGGGIPTSVGILRGIIHFRWLRNLIGILVLSLLTFLAGVPLGNEGPAVQMGTAIGRGSVFSFAKKHEAWDRYSMTGGACAGFAVATGAPISGVLFAIEEAHQRISPMIIMVASTAVAFARLTSELLSPFFGVSIALFPQMSLVTLSLGDVWLPLVVGLAVGLFAVLFLRYYDAVSAFFGRALARLPHAYRIFLVLLATLGAGLLSFSFISTGHELIELLFDGRVALPLLLCLLVVRSTLTLSASVNSITGGMFLPTLALGTLCAAILGRGLMSLLPLGEGYELILLVLGVAACISGMMKTPLTAIVFVTEALSCYENILYVIVAAGTAFVVTEIFGAKSINDTLLERRVEEQNEGKSPKVIDTFVRVEAGAFAVGRQVRDIFWPANLFVLSIRHGEAQGAEVDEHGGKAIRTGDELHVRYFTYDENETRRELIAIVGEQEYDASEAEVI